MTLEQLDKWLQDFENNTIKECEAIMKREVPVGKTKGLQNSIKTEPQGNHVYLVGSRLEYASYVNDGRGPVYPNGKWLKWHDPDFPLANKNGDVFLKRVGPSKANDFESRTIKEFRAFIRSYK